MILPMMFLQTPGQEFTRSLAMIPVINVTMMFREAIQGVFKWDLIALTIAIELVCILAALRLAAAIVKYEDFIMGSYAGSFGKFARERLLRKG
jgi:sodium transport system permease protein